LNKNSIYLIILLTVIWVILCEELSVPTVAAGIVISAGCTYFYQKYLPLSKITGVDFLRLAIYPFYLVGQIYIAGFHAIKLILTEAKVDIVEVKTKITNDLLRVVLANSITLTPGTVSLEQKDETITVLWLREKTGGSGDLANADELIKGKLENKLLKAQK